MTAPQLTNHRDRLDVEILDFRARISAPQNLIDELRSIIPPPPGWVAERDVMAGARLDICVNSDRRNWYTAVRAGSPRWDIVGLAPAAARLELEIAGAAVEQLRKRYLLIHAGAVGYGNQGIVLPAASGSGKSTLTAALVASGFQYLSDDAAVIDPHTLQLLPFTKSMVVKRGSRRTLTPLYPRLMTDDPRRRLFDEMVWYLPPTERSWPDRPIDVRHVILPRYIAGAETALTHVPRSVALQRLIEQSMGLAEHGDTGIGAAVELLRRADCYALTVGSLPRATELLTSLVTSGA